MLEDSLALLTRGVDWLEGHRRTFELGLRHEAAERARVETNRFDAHELRFEEDGPGTHHRIKHCVPRAQAHRIEESFYHLRVELPSIRKKAVRCVAGPELIRLEEGAELRR
jgi:hypothetical protein